jgi:hypothetical protein
LSSRLSLSAPDQQSPKGPVGSLPDSNKPGIELPSLLGGQVRFQKKMKSIDWTLWRVGLMTKADLSPASSAVGEVRGVSKAACGQPACCCVEKGTCVARKHTGKKKHDVRVTVWKL